MKPTKFHNTKLTNYLGTFDSVKEYKYYLLLLSRRKRGEITELHRQVEFEIIPQQTTTVQVISPVRKKITEKVKVLEKRAVYTSDFTYRENGELVVVDVKSDITRKQADYVLRRKLMLYVHGIKITEV